MTELICDFLSFIMGFIIGLIPDMSDVWTVISNADGGVAVLFDFLKQVNFIVPLPDIVAIVVIDISIHIAIFVFWSGAKVAKVVGSFIP